PASRTVRDAWLEGARLRDRARANRADVSRAVRREHADLAAPRRTSGRAALEAGRSASRARRGHVRRLDPSRLSTAGSGPVRGAWQQSETGTESAPLLELEPADLAFFSDREDRRATHVAISLGRCRLVHLALGRGGFATENLADSQDPYVAKLRERFLRAKKVL